MKKLLIALILILLAGAGGYAYYKYGKTDDKPTVTQAAITQGDVVQAVQATGTFEALRTVQVGSQVSGTVQTLSADFNTIVHKDQVIATLDPQLLQVQVDVQQANIERQQGDIDSQVVQLDNDVLTMKRTQAQFDKGLISPQQNEAAQLQVKTRQANIDSLKKQLVQAEAQLSQAKLNVSYCTIRSPIDGVVVNRAVDIGQTVQASMTAPTFFTIATDLKTLKLSAGVDEADIGFIRPNMLVTFTVDAYGTKQFTGTVDAVRLNATTTNNVVTYPVWITVQNPTLELRPSMTANLKIIVDQASNVTKLPNQALRFRPTSDTYTWLGMTPPAAGRGRGGNAKASQGATATDAAALPATPGQPGTTAGGGRRQRNGNQGNAASATTAPGQTAAAPGQPAAVPGRAGQPAQVPGQPGQNAAVAGGGRGGRGGFGRGGANNMTPEQMAQFQQQFAGRSGRGGRNRQQGQAGAAANGVVANVAPTPARPMDKIDDFFEAVPKRVQPGQVWIYDEASTDPNKKLRQVSVRLGLTDGQFSELISSGEPLAAGTMLVTGVIPPASALPKAGSTNSIFQQNQRGGFGGPQPGGGAPRGGGGR